MSEDPFGVWKQVSVRDLLDHRLRFGRQHADNLSAMVRRRTGEKRAGPHPKSRPEPHMIDIINRQPRRKRSTPAGRRPAGERVSLVHQPIEADAAAWCVKVAGHDVERAPFSGRLAADLGDCPQKGEPRLKRIALAIDDQETYRATTYFSRDAHRDTAG
jgi:hypothetical protein